MKIHIVYTFSDKEQIICVKPFDYSIIESKQSLISFALGNLIEHQRSKIIYLNTCIVVGNKRPLLPHWYLKCNGNINAKELALYEVMR